MTTAFHPIDVQTWPRGQIFYYFTKMAPTAYSLTVDLDITIMKQALKEKGLKFFPAYIWLTTKIVNEQQELKTAIVDEVLGYWDKLIPLYPTFHEDDHTLSLMWTEYNDSFSVFYNDYLKNQGDHGSRKGILSQPHLYPPANCYTISAIPWIEFKHFSFHSFENKPYFFPIIEAGKYSERDGKLLMPLSITIHHASTDGWHIKTFLEDLQNAMNHPETWMD